MASKSLKLLILIFPAFLWISPAWSIRCEEILGQARFNEIPKDLLNLNLAHQATSIEFLGNGMNGNVYRMQFANNESERVVKAYSLNPKGDWIAQDDYVGLEILENFIVAAEIPGVKVVQRFAFIKPYYLILQSIRGQTLSNFIRNESIESNVRAAAVRKYQELIRKAYAQAQLFDESPTLGEIPNLGHTLFSHFGDGTGRKTIILLKPENIIIENETHDLVIVDPF